MTCPYTLSVFAFRASPSPRGQPRSVAPGTAPHFSFSQGTCLTQLYSLHDDLVHTSFPLVLLHHSISQQCVYMCPVHILICCSVYSSHKRACAANRSHDWPSCALSNHTSVSVWQAWGNTDCSDVAIQWYRCSSSINHLQYMYIHDYNYNNITFEVLQHTACDTAINILNEVMNRGNKHYSYHPYSSVVEFAILYSFYAYESYNTH